MTRTSSITRSPYEKRANEKVVLFTGASTAWGVGASATDKTIADRMQYYLNNLQDKISYTVINMAMGSYNAYQQFLALSLWGESFQPDWVVSMDGFNDAEAGCGFSQGVGNPMFFAAAKAYITAFYLQLDVQYFTGVGSKTRSSSIAPPTGRSPTRNTYPIH
jgi:hypothetical protein